MNPESEGYNPHNFSHNYDLSFPSGGGVRRYSPLRNSRSRSRERSADEQLTFRLRPQSANQYSRPNLTQSSYLEPPKDQRNSFMEERYEKFLKKTEASIERER